MDQRFIDEARVRVTGGNGGDGSTSFLREKFKPRGRPDGGTGGDGGSVILRVGRNIATLAELARSPHHKAEHGGKGSSKSKHGANGENTILLVPDGTVVRDADTGEVLADLVGDGTEAVVASGGRGGRGNEALSNSRRRAPGFSERGEAGDDRRIELELKTLADVGLVGFPNAGKSSLIARISAARPKIANYPFTTLTPNLGVAEAAGARFVVADVPGLIEGASEGRGLGLKFLRHLERCRALCFVVDLAAPEEPADAVRALRGELRAHDPSFDARPGVLAANKIDLNDERLADARAVAAEYGFEFVAVSAVRGDGIEELADVLARAVERAREAPREKPSHRLVRLRPEKSDVVVAREGDGWRVTSARAEELLARFDVSNDEALRFVQQKLLGFGIEDALAGAGAHDGDEVRIGDLVFEFEPEGAAP